MNQLTFADSLICTTWLAEKINKTHRHVLRSVRDYLEREGVNTEKYLSFYISKQNKRQPCYKLPAHLAVFIIGKSNGSIALKLAEAAAASNDIINALNSFDIPDDMPDMYVYAIREKETGRVKLGISKHPEERLKQLQAGNSQKLELVAYKKAENRFKDEKVAHSDNKDKHIRGEWFERGAYLQ